MTQPPDRRIDQLLLLIMALASGDLTAREEPSEAGDELDAIIVGVSMLAEDLEVSRAELELRVKTRTGELTHVNRKVLAVTELGGLLQACEDRGEAHEAMRQGIPSIFERLSGAVYMLSAAGNALIRTMAWGSSDARLTFHREECWALRRGQTHIVRASPAWGPFCLHSRDGSGEEPYASACIPMIARRKTVGLLHVSEPQTGAGGELSDAVVQLGGIAANQFALALTNLELRHLLQQQALHDPMTGLYNRRFIDDWMEREVTRAQRAGTSLGILIADIDLFKQVNDVHGHDVGDRCIKEVADAMRTWTRLGDVPCRYGGEEFLIFLTNISGAELTRRAEELRAAVAIRTTASDARLPAVTVSIGAASYPEHGDTAALVVKAADAALYVAKQAGRNRVALAGI